MGYITNHKLADNGERWVYTKYSHPYAKYVAHPTLPDDTIGTKPPRNMLIFLERHTSLRFEQIAHICKCSIPTAFAWSKWLVDEKGWGWMRLNRLNTYIIGICKNKVRRRRRV